MFYENITWFTPPKSLCLIYCKNFGGSLMSLFRLYSPKKLADAVGTCIKKIDEAMKLQDPASTSEFLWEEQRMMRAVVFRWAG